LPVTTQGPAGEVVVTRLIKIRNAGDVISIIVLSGGVLTVVISVWATMRVFIFGGPGIDELSVNLLLIANIAGIAVVTFGIWMCMRGIGTLFDRLMSVVSGCVGIVAWPLLDYIGGFAF